MARFRIVEVSPDDDSPGHRVGEVLWPCLGKVSRRPTSFSSKIEWLPEEPKAEAKPVTPEWRPWRTDHASRKHTPIAAFLAGYFPDAIAELARLSKVANDQHNPGEPMHWAREKSTDHAECLIRHQLDAGTIDGDGQLHSAKVAWRALAQLQLEVEERTKEYRGK